MNKSAAVVFLVTLLSVAEGIVDAAARKPLLKDYKGSEEMPEDLYGAYEKLVRAMELGQEEEIASFSLPHSISITRDARSAKSRDYGEDMNLPFLKSGFSKYIVSLRKDSADTFLVRTSSSYFYFVRTKASIWKLYRYGDKPIE